MTITVLHVISGLGMGGAERMLVQLAPQLVARGLPQHVVTIGHREPYADELEARGVPVTALGLRSASRGLEGLARLVSVTRRTRPAVVQGWMYHGNILAALAHRLVWPRPARLFWNIRASNMDDIRYGRLIRLSAWLSRWPDVILANSQAGLAYHIERGFRPRHSAVIPNGIDTELFRPDPVARERLRAELGIGPDRVVALNIARSDPMKDHATFFAAMERLPDVTGILAGTGTEQLKVPANVRGLGARKDIPELCACADLIVSTSAFGEGFSNAIAEGMSGGLVPVVTDVGDARLIVGSCGSVVLPRDPEAFAKALAMFAALPSAERHARGQMARTRIVENFTLDKCVEANLRLYTGDVGLAA